ncbi:MAG: hypothetical protein WDZ28_05500 [Simkaniaceae bacterium]
MCLDCADVDRRTSVLKESAACDGRIIPTYTLSDLKTKVQEESQETGRKTFRYYKNILTNPPKEDQVTWMDLGGSQLKVEFI